MKKIAWNLLITFREIFNWKASLPDSFEIFFFCLTDRISYDDSSFKDDRSIFRSLRIIWTIRKKRKKKHIEYVSHERDSKFSTITRAYLLGRNEELFEFYPRRGSSNSIDNWPRSKTFLLKLRRGKQINPFQRFVKRQESTWHGYHRGGEGIEPSPIPISYLRGMNFTTRSV